MSVAHSVQVTPLVEESRSLPVSMWAALALLLVAIGTHWHTASEIFRIWGSSETYTHGYLALPAFLWMLWRARHDLATTPVSVDAVGWAALLAAAMLWLAGELAVISELSAFGLVGLYAGALWAAFGLRWLHRASLALLVLAFAVPFGEVFVPVLIEWTASMTVAGLRLSGIPVYRDGADIVVPTGRWSVVAACSGIRYLIASLFVGVLFAAAVLRSLRYRLLFVGAALVVPVVANWLRAYGIVLLGHLSDNRIAAGVDHLVYGWIFFGTVIGLLLAAGMRLAHWEEAARAPVPAAAPARPPPQAALGRGPLVALLAVTLVVGGLPMLGHGLQPVDLPAPASVPDIRGSGGWVLQPTREAWRPVLHGAVAERVFSFSKDGRAVDMFVALYRNQRHGAELVSEANVLAPDDGVDWRIMMRGAGATTVQGASHPVRRALVGRNGERLEVWHWYWLDGSVVATDVQAKLDLTLDRILRRDDLSAWVAVSTAALPDAEATLGSFLRDMEPSLDSALRALVHR